MTSEHAPSLVALHIRSDMTFVWHNTGIASDTGKVVVPSSDVAHTENSSICLF